MSDVRLRLTATLSQIATYIERDGMSAVAYSDRGARGVARTYSGRGFSVTIEPEDIPELDELRERVARRLHERGTR